MKLNEMKVVTPTDFDAWLQTAGPGGRIEYFRGELAIALDRPNLTSFDKQVKATAARAKNAEKLRLICLVQKRNDNGDYSYLAVKRHPPKARFTTPLRSFKAPELEAVR